MYIRLYKSLKVYIYILGKSRRQISKRYAQDEKKKGSYVDVVNGTHFNNINLLDIYLDLLKGEENNSTKTDTSPSHAWTNSVQSLNHSRGLEEESDSLLSTQDKEILSILEELAKKNDM